MTKEEFCSLVYSYCNSNSKNYYVDAEELYDWVYNEANRTQST